MIMTLKIVDVASYQGNYIVGSTGEDGVIAKATEGVTYVNPYCDPVIQQSVRKKMAHGIYHFASYDDPTRQARFFVNNTINYFKEHKTMGVLDYEINHPLGAKKFITLFNKEFNRLTGGKCMVYTSKYVVQALQGSDLPLWLAYYPYNSTAESPATWAAPMNKLPKVNYFLSMWQFTTSHNKLDRSIFFGDSKAWDKLATKK